MIKGICPQIVCVFYSLIIMCSFFHKKKIASIENNLFGLMIVGNFIGLFLDIISYLALMNEWNHTLGMILCKMILIYLVLWILTMTLYIYSVSLNNSYKEKEENTQLWQRYTKFKKLIIIIKIISILLCMILPVELVKDGTKIYSKGSANDYLYFLSILLMISWIFILLKNHESVRQKKFYPMYAYIVLGAFTTLLQFKYPEIILITPVECFITILIYFTIENPDVQILEQLKLAKDTAELANHAKSDFLSNMSHEIRTPLNAIVGFSESLKEDNIPRESREKVDDIIMASNNLLELVNGILDISKIEANKLEIIDKEYNINLMLEELIALTKARIGDKGLDFRIEIDKSLPAILYGDNVRLKQIILNVLTNAVKYTKEGFIDFKVSSIIKDDVCRLIISVEDSGIGIKEENLPKVFSKFERLNVEKQLTIEGTGLGLAITKRLVDLMHGKIIVQSIYGQGSKFTISIDQRIISLLPEPIKETKKSQSSVIDATGSKILIVDDNELNIKVAKTLLTKYHFTIDSCTSGAEALTKIKDNQSYDFILMDDMMPRMSGRQTFQELQKRPDFHIPTIILTANAIDGMRDEYLSLGFDDYLSKPINKTELERVITKFVNQKNISKTAGNHSVSTTSIIKDEFDLPKMKEILTNQQAINEVKNILIVDDNELNLKVAQTMLKHYGYNLTTCQSGRDCIAKVIENKYDLILMDEMMPGLSGCDTLKNLQDIEGFTVPVILVTAASKDEVASKITTYGFADYLSKPLNKELLNDTILKYLK